MESLPGNLAQVEAQVRHWDELWDAYSKKEEIESQHYYTPGAAVRAGYSLRLVMKPIDLSDMSVPSDGRLKVLRFEHPEHNSGRFAAWSVHFHHYSEYSSIGLYQRCVGSDWLAIGLVLKPKLKPRRKGSV